MAPVSNLENSNTFYIKKVWVGDSRFVGLSKYASDGDKFICQESMGLIWLKNTAIPKIKNELTNLSSEVVILAMGVNDLSNISGYINAYKDLMSQYDKVRFLVISVNPVDDSRSPYAKNSDIEAFNDRLKKEFPNNYVDVYNQIKNDVASNSSDGIHYNDTLNKKIYDIISNAVGGIQGTSSVQQQYNGYNTGGTESTVQNELVARPIIITKRYEYYSGKRNSNVISFTFEFQGMCVDKINIESSLSVDTIRNEMLWVSGNKKYTGKIASNGTIMGLSSSSPDNLERKSLSMWSLYSNVEYGATLEIIGDPTVKVGSYCMLAVYTKYGLLHHTSGIYYIKDAQDSISGGVFTTTLTLRYVGNSKDNVKAYLEGSEDTVQQITQNDMQYIESSEGNNNIYYNTGTLSDSQKTLVDIAESNKDKNGNRIQTIGGYCAQWVEDVYHAAGLYTGTYGFGNAIDYWDKWKSSGSSDMNTCPPGACVVGAGTGSAEGNLYGHIGIYLGNGKIADNIGSHRTVTVEEWRSFNKGNCGGKSGIHGWCWPFGKSLV